MAQMWDQPITFGLDLRPVQQEETRSFNGKCGKEIKAMDGQRFSGEPNMIKVFILLEVTSRKALPLPLRLPVFILKK